jgi:hypothetical protein
MKPRITSLADETHDVITEESWTQSHQPARVRKYDTQ